MDSSVRELSEQLLGTWPLPRPAGHSDKEDRGHALVIAGSRELPGAALLAVNTAFRAGCGKVTLMTGQSIAVQLAVAVPEARVVGLSESVSGGLAADRQLITETLRLCNAVLMGPGLTDEDKTSGLVKMVLENIDGQCVVLDALAMDIALQGQPFRQKVLLTPHAGEMAHLTRQTKDAVCANLLVTARLLAEAVHACVLLKGAESFLVPVQGEAYRHKAQIPGLAISGSGDVLAGLIVGLLARGATLEQAAAWSVVAHATAGKRLATSKSVLGYLARELPAELPGVLQSIATPRAGN
ncbi:MAG: NAD(P)H-hydrate dehydratase [Pseudomonadota bacterium]